jgi:hypothetical protein
MIVIGWSGHSARAGAKVFVQQNANIPASTATLESCLTNALIIVRLFCYKKMQKHSIIS